LFNPKRSSLFQFEEENIPDNCPFISRDLVYRGMEKQLGEKGSEELKIDLYHG
jgi:hypothetical protein